MIIPANPVHPGRVLRNEFLGPLNLTPYRIAKATGVPRIRIERLARCETSVTANTALRLGGSFSTGPEFWINLQMLYDVAVCARDARDVEAVEPLRAA